MADDRSYDDEDDDVGYADAYEEYDEDDEYREDADDAYVGDDYDESYADEYYGEEDDASWTGIAAALVLVGAVLFFFPEPITSSLGVLLVVAGVGLWVVDWMT